MHDNEEIVRNLTSHYTYKVEKAFNNSDDASQALEVTAKSLKEIYRYFEPAFFNGDFFVCKNLGDNPCFDEKSGTLLYDKNILLNRTDGLMIIQVFNDKGKMILWENNDPSELFAKTDTLTYHYSANKEYFFANGQKIDLTIKNFGSRYATQFSDLKDAIQHYAQTKILKSTCKHFSESWADKNRLFFRGGGRGNNIPEKFMQLSLHEYLSSYPFESRGISMESSREYNTVGDFTHPKPVDVKLVWREANRIAIIEVKFMGSVVPDGGGKMYSHQDARANVGINDIKEYHDAASSDSPTSLIKSYLIVIDGRRNNLRKGQTTITALNGMHFKNVDIIIDDDKKFHETIQGFEKPIRIFAEPICS